VKELPRLPVNAEVSNWIAGQFEEGYRGHAVDVGASDGVFINSTWLLEKHLMWKVISIEANPLMKELLMKERAFVKMCAVASETAKDVDFHINLDNIESCSALKPVVEHWRFKKEKARRWSTVKVNVRTLEDILAEEEFTKLDALCVDVEGGELDVLKGIDLGKWQPRVIVVECWDNGGLDHYLVPKGYVRTWRSAENDCYLREDW